jgi:hypothetical protein
MRDYATYKFEVKEGEASRNGANDAPVSLYCQPVDSELSIVGKGFLSLNLKAGTTIEKAQEVARYLESVLKDVSYTR